MIGPIAEKSPPYRTLIFLTQQITDLIKSVSTVTAQDEMTKTIGAHPLYLDNVLSRTTLEFLFRFGGMF